MLHRICRWDKPLMSLVWFLTESYFQRVGRHRRIACSLAQTEPGCHYFVVTLWLSNQGIGCFFSCTIQTSTQKSQRHCTLDTLMDLKFLMSFVTTFSTKCHVLQCSRQRCFHPRHHHCLTKFQRHGIRPSCHHQEEALPILGLLSRPGCAHHPSWWHASFLEGCVCHSLLNFSW